MSRIRDKAKVSNYYTGNLSMGSLVYRKTLSTTLQSTDFAAGRIYASTTGTGSDVRYYTRDHLGSTRLITGGDGTVLERSDYYPFGLRMAGGTQATGNRWRFAGKEEQKEGISLDWLNFGARMYDPFLVRWTTQDPLAEKYPGISPYAYCAGDPVNLVDPEGMIPRIYVQSKGLGHAFITTGEGNQTKVYTYGRYGDLYPLSSGITLGRFNPTGEGVLGILEGSSAFSFLESVKNEGAFDIFELSTGDDKAIDTAMKELFDSGQEVTTEQKKNIAYNPNYKVIDDYNLLDNNCVTTTREIAETGGVLLPQDTISPVAFSRQLSNVSTSSTTVQVIYNPQQFLQSLLSILYKSYIIK